MTSLLSLLINQFSLLLKNSKLLWNWNSIEVFGTLLHIGFLGEKKGMLGSEKREERSLLPLPIIFPCALLPFPPLPSHKKPLQRRQDLKNCMAFLNQTMKGMKKKIIYWVAWGKPSSKYTHAVLDAIEKDFLGCWLVTLCMYLYSCLHVKDGSSFDISSQGIIFTKVPLWNISTHNYNIFQNPIWCEGQWWLSKKSSRLNKTCPCGLPCWVWIPSLCKSMRQLYMCVFS